MLVSNTPEMPLTASLNEFPPSAWKKFNISRLTSSSLDSRTTTPITTPNSHLAILANRDKCS
jgi:hypothetical protein